MNKKAVSVTLSPDNLLWLRARTIADKNRSLSEALDGVIRAMRANSGQAPGEVRSVVGTVTLPKGDLELRRAARSVRKLFEDSLSRPLTPSPRARKLRKR